MIELNQTASILLYINIVLLGTFSMYFAYRYHFMSKVFIIATICIFAIPAMFRYDVGIDYVQYIPVVKLIGNNSSLSRALMFTYKEPTLGVIFYYASSIFKNIRVGFSVYALATQFLFILSCWKYRKIVKPYISVFMYGCLYYYETYNTFRQALAIAIVIWGLEYIFKKKYAQYLICVAIATSFHYSALISLVLLFYFNSSKNGKQKTVFKSYVVPTVCALFITQLIPLVQYIPIVSVYAKNYIREYSFTSIFTAGTILEVYITLGYIYYRRKSKVLKTINTVQEAVLDKAFYCRELFYVLGFLLGDVQRIGEYFFVPYIFSVALMCSTNSINRWKVPAGKLIGFSYAALILLSQVVQGYFGIMPYKFWMP